MKLSSKAENILGQLIGITKQGELRKIAKEIKKDHPLAMELWSTENFLPRMLAILIMDNKGAIGEKTGLFNDKMVLKGCTPEFIRIESKKRNI